MLRQTTILLLIAVCGFAQEGRISGPLSGVVFDEPTHSVRAIVGVPGGSYFGSALLAGLERAAVSPDGRFAIGQRGDQIVGMALDQPETVLGAAGSLFTWNSTSTAAVYRDGGRLMIWKAGDAAAREAAALPGEVTSLAADSQGRSVYAAISGDGIYRYRENEDRVLLAPVANAASLALSGDDATLMAVDRGAKQVLEIDAGSGGSTLFPQNAADPVAVALSKGGANVLVADGEGKSVSVYNRSSRAPVSTLELSFSPSRLDAISDGIYALNWRGSADALEVVALQPQLSAYFVPAPEEN
ncbi:MAG: hypothetical protein IT165_07795 [Bryobacterales bacterium]|nr:hypothetical protein [Bryobacterales bacterium]